MMTIGSLSHCLSPLSRFYYFFIGRNSQNPSLIRTTEKTATKIFWDQFFLQNLPIYQLILHIVSIDGWIISLAGFFANRHPFHLVWCYNHLIYDHLGWALGNIIFLITLIIIILVAIFKMIIDQPQDLPMTSSLGHVMPSSAAITPEPHLGTMPVRFVF